MPKMKKKSLEVKKRARKAKKKLETLKHALKEPSVNSNSFPTACEELKKTLPNKSDATKSSLDIHGNGGATHSNDKVGKSNEDTVLKQLTTKYTCVGSTQVIPKPISNTANDRVEPKYFKTCAEPYKSAAKFKNKSSSAKSESKAANDKSKISDKQTEKFIVRNISKVLRLYKVSNLNYRIKPVRHMTPKNLVCPVIYIGEPAFLDPEDFSECDTNTSSLPPISSSFIVEILNGVNENHL
ncbi:uncharacterized protein LOC120348446 [Styela clava]